MSDEIELSQEEAKAFEIFSEEYKSLTGKEIEIKKPTHPMDKSHVKEAEARRQNNTELVR